MTTVEHQSQGELELDSNHAFNLAKARARCDIMFFSLSFISANLLPFVSDFVSEILVAGLATNVFPSCSNTGSHPKICNLY